MKVLVVGGGGREHAIIRKLKESPRRTALYAAPGNGGIASDAVCVPIAATDVDGRGAPLPCRRASILWSSRRTTRWCWAWWTRWRQRAFPPSAPTRPPPILEGSKVFSKNLMKKYGIPTAAYEVFDGRGRGARLMCAPTGRTRLSSRRTAWRWARAC